MRRETFPSELKEVPWSSGDPWLSSIALQASASQKRLLSFFSRPDIPSSFSPPSWS